MRQNPKLWGAICVCLLAVALSVGCAKKTPVTPPPADSESASESVESTSDVTPANGTGQPITSPVAGTAARNALMDAARVKLGTTSQFVVYQLFVQGDYAVGDLETSPGDKRQFVAFKGPEWQVLWVAPYGSETASSAAAKSAVYGISDELLAKIDWKYKKPVSDAAMADSLASAAKGWSKTLMEGLGEPYKVIMVKVAQDNSGAWWGRVIVQPTSTPDAAFEPIDFWCRYSSGAWTGKARDPEPPAPGSYYPAEVAGALGF